MSEIKSDKKPKKTFKEYYADPEYKKKHLAHMLEKVTCECGQVSSRNNMPKHKKTSKHLRAMKEKETKDDKFWEEFEELLRYMERKWGKKISKLKSKFSKDEE